MASIKRARTVQYPLHAEFTFNLTDTMKDINGVEKAFAAGGVWEPIPLPPNAVLVGGDMTVETASDDTGTSTIKIGDSASDVRNLALTDIKTVARTSLTLTGFRGVGNDVRMTLVPQNGNAANGKITLRVAYIVTGRANESQIS